MTTNTLSQRIRINDKRLDEIALTTTFSDNGVDISGTLGVSGEVTLRDNLEVYGDTYLRTDVDISGSLGVSGEATFEEGVNLVSTLDVSGITTLDDSLYVNADTYVNESLDVSGTLGVSGETNLDGGLVVTSDASFNGHVDISGRLDISGSVFLNGVQIGTFVDDVFMEKNLDVSGNFGVSGESTFDGSMNVNANAFFDEDVDVSGTLGVSGETTLDSTLYVNANAFFDENVDVSGTLGVSGETTLDSTLHVNANAFFDEDVDVSGTLGVSGETTLDDTLYVNANAFFDEDVDVSGTLGVSGETTLDGGLIVTSDASFVGHVDISGRLDVSGDIYLNGIRVGTFVDDVFMHKNLGVSGDLDISGETTLDGGLIVSSDASFLEHVYMVNNVDISGTLDVSGETTLNGHLSMIGEASFSENVHMSKRLDVFGDASFNDSIQVEKTIESKLVIASERLFTGGDVSLNQDVDIGGRTKMTGGLIVNSDASFNSDIYVSGQINATSLNVSDSTFTYTTTHITSEHVDISDNVLMLGTAMDQNVASGICVKDISGGDASSNIFFGWSGRTENQTIKNKFFIGRVQDTFDNTTNKDSDVSFNIAGQDKVDTYVTGDVFSNGRNLYDWSHQIYSVIAEVADLSGGAHSPPISYTGSWPLCYGAGTSDVSEDGFGTVAIINSKLVEVYITGSDLTSNFDVSFSLHKIGNVNGDIALTNIDDNANPIEIGFNTSMAPMKHHVFTDAQMSRGDIFAWKVGNIVGGAERLRMTMIFTPTIAPVLSIGNSYGVIGRNAIVEHPDASNNMVTVTTENAIYDTSAGEFYQETIYSDVTR